MQVVERVEELFLGAFLVLQELDVIDQQHVDMAIAGAKLLLPIITNSVDEFVGEFFRVHVTDSQVRMHLRGVVCDGVQQVGLAETGVAVDEQRVVRAAGCLGDGDGGGMRKAVAVADHEGLEGVALVQPRRWSSGRAATHRHQPVCRTLLGVIGHEIRIRGRSYDDRELDRTVQRGRHAVDHKWPELAVEQLMNDLVGCAEEHRAVEHADGADPADPRPIGGGQAVTDRSFSGVPRSGDRLEVCVAIVSERPYRHDLPLLCSPFANRSKRAGR